EIAEQSKGVDTVIDESLNQELHDEVAKNGLKLGNSRQVDLPKEPKSDNGGATTLKSHEPATVAGNFTLQVGSHPALEEAKNQMTKLEEHGLKPFLKEVELGGKGKWYRVYLGDFASKDTAEKAGEKYRSEQVIRSFIVAKNAAQ
ncbi:MAG: SPOR domain-containing protein, partial [Bdellovibrionota bacterium]